MTVPPIIAGRLAKALRMTSCTSRYHRLREPKLKRRGTYQNGVQRLPERLNFKVTIEMRAQVDATAERLRVAPAVLLRDAVEMYLWLCEQEHIEQVADVTQPRWKKPGPGRRPKMSPKETA